MTIQIANRSYKGISTLTITRLTDNVVYSFPSPSTFSVASNIEEKIQMTRNELGEKARANTFKMGETPELTVSYDFLQAEMVAFRLGRQLATGTFATSIPRQVLVTQEDVPADASGGIYFPVAADAAAIASVIVAGISTPLTRQPFATFDNTDPLSFAVGGNGALKFSTDLVAQREVVTLVIPVTGLTAVSLSDALVGPLAIRAKVSTSTGTVDLFECLNASVNLSTANFDFGGEGGSEMGFYLNSVPGECQSWRLFSTPLTLQC
jgi:hypothetical protein